MAFNIKNLAPIGNQNKPIQSLAAGALGEGAPCLWSYITEDAHATVDDSGYFNATVAYKGAYNLLHLGDIIFVVVSATGTPTTYGTHLVVEKAAGVIDTTNVTVGLMTDTN